MPTTESDEMLTLLQEKAVLKRLDEEYEASPKTAAAKKKYSERRRRHVQIGKEILRLGKLSKQESGV